MNINVVLIAVCNAAAFCSIPVLMFVGSIIGVKIAPSPDLATVPIAVMVIGTAVGTVPVSILMGKIGSKPCYLLFILLGACGCFIASVAVAQANFLLFCSAAGLIGVTNACVQQFRFAAMESVSVDKAATAASIVLCGGIFGAFVGPELALKGQFLSENEYQGSFWLAAICYLVSALMLIKVKLAPAHSSAQKRTSRPMADIVKNPTFCLAVASATIAYVTMSFLMTATPISMHNHHGHSLLDTKWVIQSHIAAMFLPSLIGPLLIRLLTIKGLMLSGLIAYSLTIFIGFNDISVSGYWFQLVLLGIGWNFLFVAGTSLLPTSYQPGEQYKARAFNDGFVFSAQAIASLSAGWVISVSDWNGLLMICVAPIIIMLLIMIWSQRRLSANAV